MPQKKGRTGFEVYTLTAKDLQQMIHFFTEKDVRLDKIKGYLNVKRSHLQADK